MLQGKIIRDGDRDYCVKVGSVIVDITDDIRVLIASPVILTFSQSSSLTLRHHTTPSMLFARKKSTSVAFREPPR